LSLGIQFFFFVVLPVIFRVVGWVNPWRPPRLMAPALLTVFSTASSSATSPVTVECVENNAAVSNRVSAFVLPLGATVQGRHDHVRVRGGAVHPPRPLAWS
jgi:Na+/H+-dicarboxylate symporter